MQGICIGWITAYSILCSSLCVSGTGSGLREGVRLQLILYCIQCCLPTQSYSCASWQCRVKSQSYRCHLLTCMWTDAYPCRCIVFWGLIQSTDNINTLSQPTVWKYKVRAPVAHLVEGVPYRLRPSCSWHRFSSGLMCLAASLPLSLPSFLSIYCPI